MGRFSKILIVIFCALFFSDCSISKRHYRKGFYVEYFAKQSAPLHHPTQPHKSNQSAKLQVTTPIIETAKIIGDSKKMEASLLASSHEMPRELAKKQHKVLNSVHVMRNNAQHFISSGTKKLSATKKYDEKSQIIALILCIAVGVIGIHRFYLGYYGIGILQVFTLGGCGIWTLIDLILIITGDLKPKDGEYDETF